jgi:hypothetical protein
MLAGVRPNLVRICDATSTRAAQRLYCGERLKVFRRRWARSIVVGDNAFKVPLRFFPSLWHWLKYQQYLRTNAGEREIRFVGNLIPRRRSVHSHQAIGSPLQPSNRYQLPLNDKMILSVSAGAFCKSTFSLRRPKERVT